MIARCQRFLDRVRGTQRIIFFVILAYDIYIYWKLMDGGMGWFAALVVSVGVTTGTLAAWLLANAPITMERVMNAAGYGAMAIFLISRGANIHFPIWVFVLSQMLLWFWFTTFFWFASRPYEFAFTHGDTDDEDA